MTSGYFSKSHLTWQLSTAPQSTRPQVLDFIETINTKHGLNLKTYHDLHEYSVTNYDFWLDLWTELDFKASVPPSKVYEPTKNRAFHTWFPGARLNFAENLLVREDDGIAVTYSNENYQCIHYSWKELHDLVRQYAAALRVNGLQVGDRVAAIISNRVEAIAIALATISLGGIYSSTATDMGPSGILDRYRQIQPKFIFSDVEVQYSGKIIDLREKVNAVVTDSALRKGLIQCILLPSIVTGKALGGVPSSTSIAEFLATGDNKPLTFAQLPFDHPAFIVYSSGTSGPPKCIVHSGCAGLMHGKKDKKLAYDLRPGQTFFQYTTTGWIMWTAMICALSLGVRIVLYDGSPFVPDIRTYLKFISDQGVNFLGTSPRFLSEVKGQGITPMAIAPFKSLRGMSVTGAVFTPPMQEWTQNAFSDSSIGRNVHIISMSGGTDVCAGFITGTPILPTYAGEIQTKALGMAVSVFSSPPSRQALENSGEPGELVITRPHPSVPRFWGDDEKRSKMYNTYFGEYDDQDNKLLEPVWRQGDFIVMNPKTKGFVHLGRSDGVLNPSGIRFGSAEIYTVLEAPPFTIWIEDTLCIGQQRLPVDTSERVLLFIKMRPSEVGKLTTERKELIRKRIGELRSKRHVPDGIWEVKDIPYTVNGKKIEIAVKNIVSGRGIKNSGTVANPESLKEYEKFRDIEKYLDSKNPTISTKL
ncbi:acetoacetate-CoA ligase [Flagelloscypha sp. PMI_526]|nr:acetoacetate-CoA ligase [Flagelloscypha sp. PMI_526]